jgi:ketosteroid isomerase-like protein
MSILADDLFLADGRDREVLPEWYADYFSKGNYWGPGTIDKIEISASGDIAYTIISWEFFNEESSNGKSTNVVVWGKQADGTWKMVAW